MEGLLDGGEGGFKSDSVSGLVSSCLCPCDVAPCDVCASIGSGSVP